jgi:hypothetical protein
MLMWGSWEVNDIVERLEHYAKLAMPHYPNDLCSVAKREIEQLRAEYEASDEVSRAAHVLVVAREERELMILAHFYKDAPLKVANLCDNVLDRSGGLLGRVRERARASALASDQRGSET